MNGSDTILVMVKLFLQQTRFVWMNDITEERTCLFAYGGPALSISILTCDEVDSSGTVRCAGELLQV